MQMHNSIKLLAIIIVTIILYYHQASAKKSVLSQKHSNHSKHQTKHNKQQLLHQNKHNKQQLLQQNKHKNLINKQHHTHKSKGHLKLSNNKLSHRLGQSINPILQSHYCQPLQHLRIIEGNIAKTGQFPYAAAIYQCKLPTNSIKNCRTICGGSIINVMHILTAAHCLYGVQPSLLLVRVGFHDLKTPEVHGTIFPVMNTTIHENNNPKTASNDIGLIKLKHPMTFTEFIQPVCINGLHFNYDFPLLNVILAGWGFTRDGGPTSDVLKQAKLFIKDFSSCRGIANEKVLDFCVNAYNFVNGFSCKGDSGSGLLPLDKKQHPVNIIVGLLTGGGHVTPSGVVLCGNPMFFVNITTYAQWINKAVGERKKI